MDRTPIRIRGRRREKASIHAVMADTTKSPKHSMLCMEAGSNPSNSITSGKYRTTQGRGAVKSCKMRELSLIEQLPPELLRIIFVECANLNLPATSIYLARTLSVRQLYLEITFLALFDPGKIFRDSRKGTWADPTLDSLKYISPVTNKSEQNGIGSLQDVALHELNAREMLERLSTKPRPGRERKQLQVELLKARFFDWQFALDFVHRAHTLWTSTLRPFRQLWNDSVYLELTPELQWWLRTTPEELVKHIGHAIVDCQPCVDFPTVYLHSIPWMADLTQTPLPSKVIEGPWDDNTEALLKWLKRIGAGTARLGRLTQRPEYFPISTDCLQKAVQSGRAWVVYELVLLRVPATTQMVRTAMTLKPFPFVIIHNLLWSCRNFGSSVLDTLDKDLWDQLRDLEQTRVRRLEARADTRAEDLLDPAIWLRRELTRARYRHAGMFGRAGQTDDTHDEPYHPANPAIWSVLHADASLDFSPIPGSDEAYAWQQITIGEIRESSGWSSWKFNFYNLAIG